MKKWNTPVVEELSVMETAGGHASVISEKDYPELDPSDAAWTVFKS